MRSVMGRLLSLERQIQGQSLRPLLAKARRHIQRRKPLEVARVVMGEAGAQGSFVGVPGQEKCQSSSPLSGCRALQAAHGALDQPLEPHACPREGLAHIERLGAVICSPAPRRTHVDGICLHVGKALVVSISWGCLCRQDAWWSWHSMSCVLVILKMMTALQYHQ